MGACMTSQVVAEISERIAWAQDLKKDLLTKRNDAILYHIFKDEVNRKFADEILRLYEEYQHEVHESMADSIVHETDTFLEKLDNLIEQRRKCLDVWRQ